MDQLEDVIGYLGAQMGQHAALSSQLVVPKSHSGLKFGSKVVEMGSRQAILDTWGLNDIMLYNIIIEPKIQTQ